MSFENGLPKPGGLVNLDTTAWGVVPNVQAVTRTFDSDPQARPMQDVGFDGLSDEQERNKFSNYLIGLQNNFGTGSKAYQDADNDPANDDYHYYRGDDYDVKIEYFRTI